MELQQPPAGVFVCARCGASFETQEELDRHVESEDGEDDEEQTPTG